MTKLTNVKAMELAIELAQGNDELVEKLTKIKASFEKKTGGEKKPTAKQIENVGYRDEIVSYLADGEKHTISEMIKEIAVLAENEVSNQRCSAIVRGLVADGVLVREEIKRKAYFSLA